MLSTTYIKTIKIRVNEVLKNPKSASDGKGRAIWPSGNLSLMCGAKTSSLLLGADGRYVVTLGPEGLDHGHHMAVIKGGVVTMEDRNAFVGPNDLNILSWAPGVFSVGPARISYKDNIRPARRRGPRDTRSAS